MGVIQPGVICILIRCDPFPEYIGRTLEAKTHPEMSMLNAGHGLIQCLSVEVDAPWLPPCHSDSQMYWACPVAWLLPVSGPGIGIDEPVHTQEPAEALP